MICRSFFLLFYTISYILFGIDRAFSSSVDVLHIFYTTCTHQHSIAILPFSLSLWLARSTVIVELVCLFCDKLFFGRCFFFLSSNFLFMTCCHCLMVSTLYCAPSHTILSNIEFVYRNRSTSDSGPSPHFPHCDITQPSDGKRR